MRNRLLEATVIINQKTTTLINTSMEIFVNWSIEVKEQEDGAAIHIRIRDIDGKFQIIGKVDSVLKKKCEYEFRTDGEWQATVLATSVNIQQHMIEPVSAIIDFDNKTATINF